MVLNVCFLFAADTEQTVMLGLDQGPEIAIVTIIVEILVESAPPHLSGIVTVLGLATMTLDCRAVIQGQLHQRPGGPEGQCLPAWRTEIAASQGPSLT